MFFKKSNHSIILYNILLKLARNKIFYEKLNLPDTFETRIYLMFFHFSIILKVYKKKGEKFDQNQYDKLFHTIENNLRELGFGDVSVNDKMKNLNKILYDILLKVEKVNRENVFKLDPQIIKKYFKQLSNEASDKFAIFNDYFEGFFNYCFDISLKNMLKGLSKKSF